MSLPDDNEEILPQDQRKDQEEVDPDTERALFLKAFAEDTTKSFNITEEEAYDYLKKFVWLMIHTWNEDDIYAICMNQLFHNFIKQ